MQFRFLLNSEQKIVAAKNYTLAGISYLLRIWGIERSGFFNGREKWAKGFENQRV